MTPETINGLFAVGGAVLGAVLTGGFSLYQSMKNVKRKELSVYSSEPSKLIAVDKMLTDVVEISINGKKVPTVYIIDAVLANTGNEVISDIRAMVSWGGDSEVLSTGIEKTNFTIQDNDIVVEKAGDLNIAVRASYLNPGDEVIARSLFSGRPKRWQVEFRQPGVSLKKRITDTGLTSVFLKTLFEGIRSNWFLHSYFKLALPQYRKYLESQQRDEQSHNNAN